MTMAWCLSKVPCAACLLLIIFLRDKLIHRRQIALINFLIKTSYKRLILFCDIVNPFVCVASFLQGEMREQRERERSYRLAGMNSPSCVLSKPTHDNFDSCWYPSS